MRYSFEMYFNYLENNKFLNYNFVLDYFWNLTNCLFYILLSNKY